MVDLYDVSPEMSLHIESDGGLMEKSAADGTATAAGVGHGTGDATFYSVSRKSASARRIINCGRNNTTRTEPVKSYGSATTTPIGRQSLLGRPVNARLSRRDARYRRCQVAVYNFLERPKNWRSILYHLLV